SRAPDHYILNRAIWLQVHKILYCRVGSALPRRHAINHARTYAGAHLRCVATVAACASGLVAVGGAARYAGSAQDIAPHRSFESLAFGGIFLGFLLGGRFLRRLFFGL